MPLPGLGSIGGLSERPDGGPECWFGYTDHTTPSSVFRYDARTGQTIPWASAPGTVEVPTVHARLVTYTSRDGTPVRMIVVSTQAEPDHARPTILGGYGGFGASMTPGYSATMLAWVEAGGVYAVANLRGGGEEGESWHRAGMRGNKQNVFDDFHAAADWLSDNGWTTPSQLGISGGSNGGLLVGAALTQAPEKYAAVACSAPLLDMVRYEKFGFGQLWSEEYGTAEDPEELGWLFAYSPYHHVETRHRVPGGAVHRLRLRHPGRPAARAEDVRGPAGRDGVEPADHLPPRERCRARRSGGESQRRPLRRHAGLPGHPHRPGTRQLAPVTSSGS